ncbi:MAG: MopE-related protein [bacterium]
MRGGLRRLRGGGCGGVRRRATRRRATRCCSRGAERCNGVDDDCDGTTDEGFVELGAPCEGGVGECRRPGGLVCAADGVGYVCDAVPGPAGEERCNTRDDDCDGVVDEGFDVGAVCAVGVGACAAEGRVRCDALLGEPVCNASAGFPQPERCNGVDDDCDGVSDEDFATLGDACQVGVGACAVAGVVVCGADGRDVRCDAEAGRVRIERCNGEDDDCDGELDEGFGVGEPCLGGVGSCARPGVGVCGPDGEAACAAEPGPPGVEACDGVDEDCDGAVDEDFVAAGLGRPCGDGVGGCAVEGTGICAADGRGVVCDAVASAPMDERCNRRDDDCDGALDEDFPELGLACTAGEGVCRASGRLVCGVDEALVCDAQPGQPRPERCDRRDDDCDGTTDEDFPGLGGACAVGVGRCRAVGEVVCAPGGAEARCSVNPGAPRAERCDGVDDDCDGAVDEDFGPGCARQALEVEAGAYHTCARRPDEAVLCWGNVDPPPAGPRAALAAGSDWHCALDAAGAPTCWGDGPAVIFVVPPGPFTALALGDTHGCGLAADGVVTCWGQDVAGETRPPAALFETIAAGPALTCGVERDTSAIRCWGQNDSGRAEPPAGVFVALDLGTEHGCAVDVAGAIACWGAASLGRLEAPVGVWSAVTVGGYHACALDDPGVAACWGAGGPGAGAGFPHFGQSEPPDAAWAGLSAGGYHTCGRTLDDAVLCFGAGGPEDVPDGLFHEGQSTVP